MNGIYSQLTSNNNWFLITGSVQECWFTPITIQKHKQNSTTLSKQSSNMLGALLFNIESSVAIGFSVFFFWRSCAITTSYIASTSHECWIFSLSVIYCHVIQWMVDLRQSQQLTKIISRSQSRSVIKTLHIKCCQVVY